MKKSFIIIIFIAIFVGTSCSFDKDKLLNKDDENINIDNIEEDKNIDMKYEFGYEDVEDHWCKSYALYLKDAGVLSQFKGSKLYPDKEITRGESTILISDFFEKIYGYQPNYEIGQTKFSDLKNDENSKKIRALSLLSFSSYMSSTYVDYPDVSETRIVDGFTLEDGTTEFRPDLPVTRAEFSKMLFSALDCFGYINLGDPYYNESDLDDHWGKSYMKNAEGFGLLEPDIIYQGQYVSMEDIKDIYSEESGDNIYYEYKPDNLITRAEAIKMIASARGFRYVGLPEEEVMSTRKKDEKQLFYYKE